MENALRYRGEEILVDVESEAAEDIDASSDEAGRVVEVGIIDGDRVQILSGLEAGENVYLQ